jgi:hypothetical protein
MKTIVYRHNFKNYAFKETSDVKIGEITWAGRHDILRDVLYRHLNGTCEGNPIQIEERIIESKTREFYYEGERFIETYPGIWQTQSKQTTEKITPNCFSDIQKNDINGRPFPGEKRETFYKDENAMYYCGMYYCGLMSKVKAVALGLFVL